MGLIQELNLTSINNVFTNYEKALKLGVDLSEASKRSILQSTAYYLSVGCLPKPGKTPYHIKEYDSAKNKLLEFAEVSGYEAVKGMIDTVNTAIKIGFHNSVDDETQEMLFQELIEDVYKTIRDNTSELISILNSSGKNADIEQLDEYRQYLPPKIDVTKLDAVGYKHLLPFFANEKDLTLRYNEALSKINESKKENRKT